MAEAAWGVNDPEAVKHWAKDLNREVLKSSFVLSRFMGTGPNSILQRRDELSKGDGDSVRFILRMKASQAGILGDANAEGNEEGVTTYTDNLLINQLRFPFLSGGKMSEQRVPFNVRAELRDLATGHWTERFDEWFFNQVCGNTAQADTRYTGLNTVTDASTNRKRISEGTANEQSLTSSHPISVEEVDIVATTIKLASPKIRPVRIAGGEYYVWVVHPGQAEDLRDSAGKLWEIWRSALAGGMADGNPLFTGALGVYNGFIFMESENIPQGIHSSTGAAVANTRRSVILGAQAAGIAFGRDGGTSTRFNWAEELRDYKNKFGVSAGVIGGLKKMIFNSEDFGCFVYASYSRV